MHWLIALSLHLPRAHKPHAEAGDEAHKLWYWLEDNGEIVFPILGMLIIAVLILGIRRGMKSNVAELQEKQERKDAIIRMMRAKLLVSADLVAGELKIDKFVAAALLDELVREGKLLEQRMVGGIANYRLKGL
jgi:hypothetical protein